MERLAPPPEKRFAAMEQFARGGILTGTCLMPTLPGLCDTDENLEAVVRWTADHGGKFVLAGALTMADQQRDYFLPADKRALDKRIVEALANECYGMELRGEPQKRVWARRKAASAIEDSDVDIGLTYRQVGWKGPETILNVGPRVASVVEPLLKHLSADPRQGNGFMREQAVSHFPVEHDCPNSASEGY